MHAFESYITFLAAFALPCCCSHRSNASASSRLASGSHSSMLSSYPCSHVSKEVIQSVIQPLSGQETCPCKLFVRCPLCCKCRHAYCNAASWLPHDFVATQARLAAGELGQCMLQAAVHGMMTQVYIYLGYGLQGLNPKPWLSLS